jgi:hypothetical protein
LVKGLAFVNVKSIRIFHLPFFAISIKDAEKTLKKSYLASLTGETPGMPHLLWTGSLGSNGNLARLDCLATILTLQTGTCLRDVGFLQRNVRVIRKSDVTFRRKIRRRPTRARFRRSVGYGTESSVRAVMNGIRLALPRSGWGRWIQLKVQTNEHFFYIFGLLQFRYFLKDYLAFSLISLHSFKSIQTWVNDHDFGEYKLASEYVFVSKLQLLTKASKKY